MSDYDKMLFNREPVYKLPMSLQTLIAMRAGTTERSHAKDLDDKIHYVKNLIRKSGYVM